MGSSGSLPPPKVFTADPDKNADGILELAQLADADGVDVVVFPEFALSAYAIDDLFTQDALLTGVERALERITIASQQWGSLLFMGAPLRLGDRLFNCAVAIARGKILGVVPKTYLPNYREYYEKRWFASGAGVKADTIKLAGASVPFGTNLIFAATDLPDLTVGVDICEDYWSPIPPSTFAALAGATLLVNLSASNVTVGKAAQRELLSAAHSSRTIAAYVFSAAGTGESTTDVAWDGQGTIHELGLLLARSDRFLDEPGLLTADVDLQRVRLERLRVPTFSDAVQNQSISYREIQFEHCPHYKAFPLKRPMPRFPYVPDNVERLDEDCYEAFNIQVHGLMRRFRATSGDKMVIGISGGLDSTHALIVAAKACDRLQIPRSSICAVTMPGFATGEATKANAWSLMRALGVDASEIDIRPAARQILRDIGHPFASGEEVFDVTFENVQAGLRTDYLFRLANARRGFVIGTGDLSELALGWCTYGVGDQMSHYAVNSGVPKTLIQHLIRWVAQSGQFDDRTNQLLLSVLATKISPELVPGTGTTIQDTEEIIGPYELHDFFLFHILKFGLLPSKIAFLACQTWNDLEGRWPPNYPGTSRRAYDAETITAWLKVFLDRFFRTSQFKRSALPNGPKVSSGGALSPRGDWRAPSDASSAAWLEELDRNGPLSGIAQRR